MLLVYTPKVTNRLGYTLGVVLRTILKVDFSITTDRDVFDAHTDAKLCYGSSHIDGIPFIKAHHLLFETTIAEQETRCFDYNGTTAIFPVFGKDVDLPFDPFAATFYMITRYEEYLPHREDEHGRFAAKESLAANNGFLHRAVVDRWSLMVADVIHKYYPDFHIAERKFNAVLTVDIDSAYCYLHKGVFRTVTGLLRDLLHRHDMDEVKRRIRVLRHREQDPYDTFDYIIDLHKRHRNIRLIFFALVADYGMFDKPISHHNIYFRQLLQHIGDYAKLGVHPSYASVEHPERVIVETKRLADILHRGIVRSRFHFLRLRLPDSYRSLTPAGILHDYSMGFAEAIGLRAGTGTPYPFYDIERDYETELTIHPFCLMDTTLQKYLRMTPAEGLEAFKHEVDELREVGGTFSFIVHNQNLGELFGWKGWREVFEQACQYLDNQK